MQHTDFEQHIGNGIWTDSAYLVSDIQNGTVPFAELSGTEMASDVLSDSCGIYIESYIFL